MRSAGDVTEPATATKSPHVSRHSCARRARLGRGRSRPARQLPDRLILARELLRERGCEWAPERGTERQCESHVYVW